MKVKLSTRRVLIWDKVTETMVARWKVTGALLGHKKSIIFELNPYYVITTADIDEAKSVLCGKIKLRWKELREKANNQQP